MTRIVFLLSLILCIASRTSAQQSFIYNDGRKVIGGENIATYQDSSHQQDAYRVWKNAPFKTSGTSVPNFNLTDATCWIRFSIKNRSDKPLLLSIENPLIDSATLYRITGNTAVPVTKVGMWMPVSAQNSFITFMMNLGSGDSLTQYVLKVNGNDQLIVPLVAGAPDAVLTDSSSRNLFIGIYTGILLVMFFYNLFVFLSTKDRSYLYYIAYIICTGLTQLTLTGYTHRFFFSEAPQLFNYGIVVFTATAGLTGAAFVRQFLNLKQNWKFMDRVFIALSVAYSMAAIFRLCGLDALSSRTIDITALIAVLSAFTASLRLAIRRYKPATYYLAAWSAFILGMILFVLRNLDVLPYNNLTNYSLLAGTALEVTLLSFALADKINVFRKEKELSQAATLAAVKENERIVLERAGYLEVKVNERTAELSDALSTLKDAQAQLVEAEKMASLGQLTAGIAHEINNPINFVTSNVRPLRRDIKMLTDLIAEMEGHIGNNMPSDQIAKQLRNVKEDLDYDYLMTEIDTLLDGIHEGSDRTAEIVKGLRVFSRVDEEDIKMSHVQEGIDSTLIIVNSMLNNNIAVEKQYGDVPAIECYPGKLNQVFLNIISNGIYAIHERYGDGQGGKIIIETTVAGEEVIVKITDNGTGMPESVAAKIFEPFFTTKNVGEGTGLGLSISYNIIRKHNGFISVISTPGQGTTFIIRLPFQQ